MNMRLILCVLCCLLCGSPFAQNTAEVQQPPNVFDFRSDSLTADSLASDTLPHEHRTYHAFGLLDTLTNDTLLEAVFKPYLGIRYTYYERSINKVRRNLPTVKEVKERPVTRQPWKFWVIISILCYIAFVRIVNLNNFKIFIASVFNLKLSEKIWEDQRSFFGFVILQLFAIYIFIAALFLSNWIELRQVTLMEDPLQLFLVIVLVLFVSYILKFALHAFFGQLLQMKNLGIGFVSNTISVNNFIALVIFPLLIFLIYNSHPLVKIILSQTIIATFFLSIIYRVVRITLLSDSFFNFPRIYLFIYLCALEVLPWFVIIKYLNRFQI